MKSVIFDLDGTLVDSAPDIHAVSSRVLTASGLEPLSFAQVRGFIGKGVPHMVERLLDASGENPHGPLYPLMVERFLLDYSDAVGMTQPYPGVVAALDALASSGFKLGICTNKPLVPAKALLAHLGLIDRFSTIFGGDSLQQKKPQPEPLIAASDAMGGRAAIFVGDSEVDAETAQAAGFPFLIFTEGYRHAPLSELCHDAAFGDFADLPDLVAGLARP